MVPMSPASTRDLACCTAGTARAGVCRSPPEGKPGRLKRAAWKSRPRLSPQQPAAAPRRRSHGGCSRPACEEQRAGRCFVSCVAADRDGAGHFAEQSSDHLKIWQEAADGNGVEERGERDGVRTGTEENAGSVPQPDGLQCQQPKAVSGLWRTYGRRKALKEENLPGEGGCK